MPLVNRCAISKKELKEDDNIVSFPFYDSKPGEPEFICCENIALRSEFENWYLRDSVIKKVREFLIQQFHSSKYFSILAEDENILIVKSKVEDNIRLFFLKYVFYSWFTDAAWKRLKDLATVEEGSIKISQKTSFSWSVDVTKSSVLLQKQIIDVEKDAIVIPITEWRDIQELLSSSR